MTSPHPILFLSGAGLPAWIWEEVRHRLGDHETQVAPRPGRTAGLCDYAEAALDSMSAERFTVVAHSAGGVVGAEVVRLAPQRVSGFLAVSAIVPRLGGSFLTAMPVPNRWLLGAAMRVFGTRPPDAALRETLAHGLDEPTTGRLIADFTPEPQAYYRDRTGPHQWGVRRGYVLTTADRELPPALQRRFAARLGDPWRHAVPTGHLPMLEDPAALAASVASFVES